ncbi:DUF5009 domain-containing protein [Pelagicoccus sp. SDUM812005]|uniref:heparan-alpha-glucosaminide N-acetyltransferase domain-containing protein n=1 Tax=Pelagicoccus sp. SDUM812005 TaxID=3041257 RepID=UPI00280E5334|nr:DUF5009 domain-containing protein [Pelagicoccus sp. SDUM812005]MDQ8182171.1 DUF5009 domain-containing protein [Pelagicoccus sp. SDUM812005]
MKNRIQSIDAYRALTMALMIWVNDFWTLSDIPEWLQHASADTDGMGFSDVIFPVFLFIVGLSIPFAIRARKEKGDSSAQVVRHIAIRSASLVFMGLLMVNLEYYHPASAGLPQALWQVLMVAAFFLIWNVYPRNASWKKRSRALRILGWALVALLLASFSSDPKNGYSWIEPRWWGILGLIGWSYLLCSLLVLVSQARLSYALAGWLFLACFNIAANADWLDFLDPIQSYVWIVGDGSLPALTLAGCVVSLLFLRASARGTLRNFCLTVASLGLALILVGFLLRPIGGISKIHATPSWTQICTGIAMLGFVSVFWLVDLRKAKRWYAAIAPAGAATLTCYLIPYLAYPALAATGWELPETLSSGAIGLIKSSLFALAMVAVTGLFNRAGLKLAV